ncbi:enoyl-CoA hydratase/isomerase family protein [Streptomyces shenzhenensis]|uniref:enoyl-CoA hydratase/isomerase family protein n=1 Tax=Streptomyces shenzhenensis TaxID=943815 RepID=UPI003D9438A4
MNVRTEVTEHGVAHVLLCRTRKRNALDRTTIEQLRDVVAGLATRSDVRVVVVRGQDGVFCAGADIGDWAAPSPQEAAVLSQLGQDTFDALADLPVPTVAVIEGCALGGGLELALACDLRISTSDAVLGLPELGLGNLPSWGGTARLVDVAGLGVTRHLLLSGELVDGARAAALLVVTSAHPQDGLDAAVEATVSRLLAAEPHALALSKRVLRELRSESSLEAALAAYTAGLESSRARKQAFLESRRTSRAARAAASTAEAS